MITFAIEDFEWKPHISVLRQTCKKLGINQHDLPDRIKILGMSGRYVYYNYMARDGTVQAAYHVSNDSLKSTPEAKGTYLYLEFE
jgi:hypothetical protein